MHANRKNWDWMQMKSEKQKEGKVVLVTVWLCGVGCQYSTAPRHCIQASWICPNTHTVFTQSYLGHFPLLSNYFSSTQ